jgi:predicted O-methyltransferase YrrM
MNLSDQHIVDYAEAHTSPEDPVLSEITAFTFNNLLFPQMISSHLQGQLLSMLSLLLRPKRILEVGTFTGYSAICLARGLREDGKMITIEYNGELEDTIRRFFDQSGYASAIELLIGDAMKVIPALEGEFDLIFIDADKKNYLAYYKMLLPKLADGGIILVDNVLWEGKVANPSINDPQTILFREFNEFVNKDSSTIKVLLPVRDGLYLIMKNNRTSNVKP